MLDLDNGIEGTRLAVTTAPSPDLGSATEGNSIPKKVSPPFDLDNGINNFVPLVVMLYYNIVLIQIPLRYFCSKFRNKTRVEKKFAS